MRRKVLGAHEPALTVVICDLFEPGWVAEAVARVPAAEGAVGRTPRRLLLGVSWEGAVSWRRAGPAYGAG